MAKVFFFNYLYKKIYKHALSALNVDLFLRQMDANGIIELKGLLTISL